MNDSKKLKVGIISIALFWLALVLFFGMPLGISINQAIIANRPDIVAIINNFIGNFTKFNEYFTIFNYQTNVFGNIVLFITIVSVVVFIMFLIKNKPKGEYDKIEHGSAGWASGDQYSILSKNQGIILGKNNYLPLNKRGNLNILVVGGSGSGKSAAFVKPNVKECFGSYVFTDPKGELFDDTAGYLQDRGYKIRLLNLVNPANSDGYNPLAHIRNEIDVDVIASTIIKGQGEGGADDPYWDNMAEQLLKALIFYLIATRPPEEQNLASCAEMVRAANAQDSSSVLTELIEGTLPENHIARRYYKSVSLASEKTFSTILSALQSKLGKFDSKEIADLTSVNTIDFDEFTNQRVALYVKASDTHSAYDFLITIFFSQMIQRLYDNADKNNGKLNVPVFFLLDEFVNIGQIPDFDKKIATSRSRGIAFHVIIQNLDQLKAVYEKTNETIIGNCDTLLFLGSNSASTLEYFSKQLGEKTIEYNSNSKSYDKGGISSGRSESKQKLARALLTPDELRRIDVNDCLIFVKGIRPIKTKKYYYYEDKNLVAQFNANKLNSNAYSVGDRGEYRLFNPNNPNANVSGEALKKETKSIIDELFDDDDLVNFKEEKVENNNEGKNDMDIAKEIEAKFDELFGDDEE